VPEDHARLSERDGWSELNAEYQRRFGISAQEATPLPRVPSA
jgi:hypothetical protein